ncbi:MAG: acyl-CoA reductase [Candidatus Binatales bacterium]
MTSHNPVLGAEASGRDVLAGSTLAFARLRESLRRTISPDRIAAALSQTCARWRSRSFDARRETLSLAARASGFSPALLDESLDALLKPFHPAAFESLAATLVTRPQLLGFIMPGNVIGAGLHEVCQALIGGAAIVLKTSIGEPHFFAALVWTLREIDPQVGARIAVQNWSRSDTDRTAAMKQACDRVVAFGADESIAALDSGAGLIAFGSRASGAIVAQDCDAISTADLVARDVALFEQRGCLSAHHVFVENSHSGVARDFGAELAAALDRFAKQFPPPIALPLQAAAGIRSARENARWRRLGGRDVAMWEGEGLGWTVIYDSAADFRFSPGYRTVYITPFRNLADLGRRLAPAVGRLEAFAIAPGLLAEVRAHLESIGVSYLAAPGEMQSPPLEWRHGRGALLDLLVAR